MMLALLSILTRPQRGLIACLAGSVIASLPVAAALAEDSSLVAEAPVTAPEPALPTEPEPELAPELEAPEPTLTASEATAVSMQNLQKRLRVLEAERAGTSNLLPWITVSTGAAVVLVSSIVGVWKAIDCEGEASCSAPPWASLTIVLGAAIGTAGTLWLVRTDDGIRELEMQTDQLKLDLERFELSHRRRSGLARVSASQISLGWTF